VNELKVSGIFGEIWGYHRLGRDLKFESSDLKIDN
jgi:hypothetical protein